jgi:tetratricopeptide (TPR) repeat protein
MKLFLLIALLFTVTLHAQNAKADAKADENAVDNMSPNQRQFFNIPEEKRKEIINLYGEAHRLFTEKRVFEALEKLNEAEKLFPNSFELHNLRGSCYVELRIFDKAIISFEKAKQISPNNLSIKFNLAECTFVSQKWQESHDKFQELLKLLPPNSLEMLRLVEFKVFICKKKLGLDQEALILADKYDYQDDSPYYYYTKAALAFDKKENAEAEQWMNRAAIIFREPKILSPWQDTMMESGYVKSFYGGEQEKEMKE